MNKLSAEERYPLLLLYVEDQGKKSQFPQRVVFAERNRGKEAIQGAAYILKQWPAQATSCWLTSIALASTFVLLIFILLVSSLNPLYHSSHLRCVRDLNNNGNKTIHLIKHGNQWTKHQLEILKFTAQKFPDFKIHALVMDTTMKSLTKPTVNTLMIEEEIPTPEPISSTTPERNHLFILPDLTSIFFRKFNDILSNKKEEITTTEKITTESIEELERKEGIIKIEDNVIITKADEAKKPHDILETNNTSTPLRRKKRCVFQAYRKSVINSYKDILNAFPNIYEDKITYNRYFDHTPLKYYWMEFNPEILNFAVRVQELWQNGGISFHLPLNSDPKRNEEKLISNNIIPKTSITTIDKSVSLKEKSDILRLKILIANMKFRYFHLSEEVVSIDGEGLHMATRIPCHAFFGEMLMKFQKEDNVSIPVFITKMLNTFCKRGAVDPEYCKTK